MQYLMCLFRLEANIIKYLIVILFSNLCFLSSTFSQSQRFLPEKIVGIGNIHSAVFSPDGNNILTANDSGAHVWEIATGEIRRSFIALDVLDLVSTACYSPDGKHILTGHRDGKVRLWDAKTSEGLRTVNHTNKPHCISALSYSPDGSMFLSSDGGELIIWRADSAEKIRTFTFNKTTPDTFDDYPLSPSFSPDGETIMVGFHDGTFSIWDVDSGERLKSFDSQGSRFGANGLAISPDGSQYLTGNWDNIAILWDAQRDEKLRTFRMNGSVHAVAFSPDGKTCLIGTQNSLTLFDIETGRPIYTSQDENRVNSVSFNSPGNRFLSASDSNVFIYDSISNEIVQTLYSGFYSSPIISSNGNQFMTQTGWGFSDHNDVLLYLWDMEQGEIIYSWNFGDKEWISKVLITKDGKIAAIAVNKRVHILDLSTGAILTTISVPELLQLPENEYIGLIWPVDISSDSHRLLIELGKLGGDLAEHLLIDIPSHTVLFSKETIHGRLSPDGSKMLGHEPDVAHIWDIETGAELLSYTIWGDQYTVRFSDDGEQIFYAIGSDINEYIAFDTNTGEENQFFQHKSIRDSWYIYPYISTDGTMVATLEKLSQGAFIKVWDFYTGEFLRNFDILGKRDFTLTFSKDNQKSPMDS